MQNKSKQLLMPPVTNTRRRFIKSVGAMSSFWLGLGSLSQSQNVVAAPQKKLGIALVGLGDYSRWQLGPALLETQHCYLSGIVTGTPAKEKNWQSQYNVPIKNTYNYNNFDAIADNDNIDIIYVVLPNSMHAEYCIRAAEAGKHVICEKPMAVSVNECQQIINSAEKAKVKLGIGYRLHYDPFNLEMMRLGQKKVYGQVTNIEAEFQFEMKNLEKWRAKKTLAGGGPIMDLGIYCIQGCIYTLGELPISISARNTTLNHSVWRSVEGSMDFTMKFASGTQVNCKTSYENDSSGKLIATAEKGTFGLKPAFNYSNLKGQEPNGLMDFNHVNQQAKQMDAFALNVTQNTDCLVPGEMGMRDVFILEKALESMAQDGKELSLQGIPNILHRV